MSLLLACLLTFGRLSEDNEILALDILGLSFRQILWPPLLFVAPRVFGPGPFQHPIDATGHGQFRSIYHKIAQLDPLQIEAKRFTAVRNVRLYAGEVLKERKLLKDVWLYRIFPDYTERVYAPNGKWEVADNRLSLTLLGRSN